MTTMTMTWMTTTWLKVYWTYLLAIHNNYTSLRIATLFSYWFRILLLVFFNMLLSYCCFWSFHLGHYLIPLHPRPKSAENVSRIKRFTSPYFSCTNARLQSRTPEDHILSRIDRCPWQGTCVPWLLCHRQNGKLPVESLKFWNQTNPIHIIANSGFITSPHTVFMNFQFIRR